MVVMQTKHLHTQDPGGAKSGDHWLSERSTIAYTYPNDQTPR
jgi:hypothetical protein